MISQTTSPGHPRFSLPSPAGLTPFITLVCPASQAMSPINLPTDSLSLDIRNITINQAAIIYRVYFHAVLNKCYIQIFANSEERFVCTFQILL